MADLVIARTIQGGLIGTVPTTIGFDDIEFQTVPTLVTTGARWAVTVRNAGRYLVSVTVAVEGAAKLNSAWLKILKNGAIDAQLGVPCGSAAPAPQVGLHLTKSFNLVAGDVIQAVVMTQLVGMKLTKNAEENWITIAELP